MRSRTQPGSTPMSTRLAVCLGAVMLGAVIQETPLLRNFESRLYDLRVRMYAGRMAPSSDIVLLAIDDESLQRLEGETGRWPWPRALFAEVIEFCREAHTVVLDVIFPEQDDDAPAGDVAFAEAVRRHGRVVSAIFLDDNKEGRDVSDALAPFALPVHGELPRKRLRHTSALIPFRELLAASRRVGFVNYLTDGDGVVRRHTAVAEEGGQLLPSLALAAVMEHWDLDDTAFRLSARTLRVGPHTFPLDAHGRFPLCPSDRAFKTYSLADVLYAQRANGGKAKGLTPADLAGKMVVVGSLATGLESDRHVTSLSAYHAGVQYHATAIDNLISGRFIREPPAWVPYLLLILATLVPAVIRLERPLVMFFNAVLFLLIIIAIALTALMTRSLMLPMLGPMVGMSLSHTGLGFLYWQKVRAHARHLEQLEEAKQRFTDMLVHDIRNQVAPVVMAISLLENRLAQQEEGVGKLLYNAESGMKRLVAQMNTLLDIRKIQEGRMVLSKRRTSLQQQLGEAIRSFEPAAKKAGVEIAFNRAREDLLLDLDADVFQRVIGNLVLNALTHGQGDNPVEVGYEDQGDGYATVWVANWGPAIPAAIQEEIFQPFVAGPRSARKRWSGTGLGLAFCRLATRAHGGRVVLQSPCFGDEGVRVEIRLPLT